MSRFYLFFLLFSGKNQGQMQYFNKDLLQQYYQLAEYCCMF